MTGGLRQSNKVTGHSKNNICKGQEAGHAVGSERYIAKGRYYELNSLLDSHPCQSAAIVYSAASTCLALLTNIVTLLFAECRAPTFQPVAKELCDKNDSCITSLLVFKAPYTDARARQL